ncbi:MAG TPA: thiamine phosphate synthase [Candidatus Blautia pullistercoris]|uniref:Thiamine-phosphate synthase n=1 Tax=Candidatus Blautia pullistercoris TaxID=2838499 RepID=A0A9D2AMS5_9FIRM|nr:thiamine phosphate synthase [Clostridiales bacterium]HIX37190.1 thiamine phosphate synthase [Candidatus Blautia pullistercoris]
MNCTKEDMLLYAVTDRAWTGEKTLLEQVKEALDGGITFLQLREKELGEEEFLREAEDMKTLAAAYHVPFIINDNVELALAIGADGVHVGQEDMEAGKVREKLGPDKIIGVSAHSVEEAVKAEKSGADYLGAGAVFSTSTKGDAGALSMETLKAICSSVSIPVVAIGGIKEENILSLKGTGVAGAAIVSGIFARKNIREACVRLRSLAKEMVER